MLEELQSLLPWTEARLTGVTQHRLELKQRPISSGFGKVLVNAQQLSAKKGAKTGHMLGATPCLTTLLFLSAVRLWHEVLSQQQIQVLLYGMRQLLPGQSTSNPSPPLGVSQVSQQPAAQALSLRAWSQGRHQQHKRMVQSQQQEVLVEAQSVRAGALRLSAVHIARPSTKVCRIYCTGLILSKCRSISLGRPRDFKLTSCQQWGWMCQW